MILRLTFLCFACFSRLRVCFVCLYSTFRHYDNPGPPNNRQISCIVYLNPDWETGHGGEITLLPFMGKEVKIAPLFNRAVHFQSNLILHRAERNLSERFCLTIWIDGVNTNTTEKSQLRLAPSAMNDVDALIRMLQKSPTQRSLSRAVYHELYLTSLQECMQQAEGAQEMILSHLSHLKGKLPSSVLKGAFFSLLISNPLCFL